METGGNGAKYDEFVVLATEFSEALDKALVYIENESDKKLTKGFVLEIGLIQEKDEIVEVKRKNGKFVEPFFKN